MDAEQLDLGNAARQISAVICTHNRVTYLEKALDSLEQQSLPKTVYEIIVIDNGSSDVTREVVLRRMQTEGNLRYVFEPKLGLSEARNRGLMEARGTYIAFLDDDAVAERDWLEWGGRVHEETKGRVGFVGGKVRPIWEASRPTWLSEDLLPFLSLTDLGDEPREIAGASGLVGANMVFRTQVLRDIGGFPNRLGRKGKRLLSNEEVQLKKALEQLGLRSLYHPKVAVSHHVTASRLTKPWFRRRLYWQGRSDAILVLMDPAETGSVRLKRIGSAATAFFRSAAHWILSNAREWNYKGAFSDECRVLSSLGYLVGLIRGGGGI